MTVPTMQISKKNIFSKNFYYNSNLHLPSYIVCYNAKRKLKIQLFIKNKLYKIFCLLIVYKSNIYYCKC